MALVSRTRRVLQPEHTAVFSPNQGDQPDVGITKDPVQSNLEIFLAPRVTNPAVPVPTKPET